MPSITYQPPVKVLNTAPSHVTKEQFSEIETIDTKQPYDVFLVLDVEATCVRGSSFEWPNEIIVCRTFTHSHRSLTQRS